MTASDVLPLRPLAAPGVPSEAHGTYRARVGASVAVLTASNLPPMDDGASYEAWMKYGDPWTRLGALQPGADVCAIVLGESRPPTAAPLDVRVTRETAKGHGSPTGGVVIEWDGGRAP